MDRPPEGMPPEKPAEENAPLSSETDRGIAQDAAYQVNDIEPPSDDLADGSAPEQIRFERLDSEDGEPTRAVIFHRFDSQVSKIRGPHFEREVESDEPEFVDHADSALLESPQTESPQTDGASDALIVETSKIEISADVAPTSLQIKHRNQSRRGEPVRHGLVMLATILAMLAAARFILPGIVEEIRYAQHRGQLRAEFEVAGEGLKNVSLDTLSQAYQMVNAAAGPSVVHIDIHSLADEVLPHPDFPGAPSILISDQGSGVVVDADGYVLTNRHVVATSDEISVTLSDGRTVNARVIGTDELTDLAVLKVDADNLIPIPWGDSERIRVGSPVWAIGSPFGLDRTVTFGILSGKHRVVRAKDRYQDFMQSDVAVNPGNSGGPLVDSRGTLVGINTAIVGDTYQGVSFAIPSSVAKKIYMHLRENGTIERGWLGVALVEVPNDQLRDENHRVRGALITELLDEDSGASRAGLKPGDLVVKVDSEKVRNVDHLMQVIGNAMAGTEIELSIIRDDREMKFDVSLGHRQVPRTRR